MNDPAPSPACPECAEPLPPDSPHALCPACLIRQALASRTVGPAKDSATRLPPPSPEEIADKFPGYEILECLGRGGMGVVYKARQKSLDRWVAIKLLAPERIHDQRFAGRFEREAKTLAKMSHPNIVTVFDHGQTGGMFFIVMEYVDGVNLRDLLREGKMEPAQALAIIPPICEALEYAHEKGVVHRDIKPENILLDRDGRVKIADFGIAKLIEPVAAVHDHRASAGEDQQSPQNTATFEAGTPDYSAPEQADGHADHRADIYALGVVLYEMLTGERPAKESVAPSQRVQIDVRLDEIVLRALEKSPELRYQTAGEFRTVVETLVQSPQTGQAPGSRDRTAPQQKTNHALGQDSPSGAAWTEQSELDAMSSDRQNWYTFLFYHCPDDPRIVVPKRIRGFGWTLNFANPWSIPFLVALIAGLFGAKVLLTEVGVFTKEYQVPIFLAVLGGVVWVCHRMSRGPVPREGYPSPAIRSLITAAIGIGVGLAAMSWQGMFQDNREWAKSLQTSSEPPSGPLPVEFNWREVVAPTLVQTKWEAIGAGPTLQPVVEMDQPPITTSRYALIGEIKHENVEGIAYLEMWSHLPESGRYFTRTLGPPGCGPMAVITGSSDWRPFTLPFDRSNTTEPVSKIEANLHLPAKGVVYLRGLRLVEKPDA